MLGMISRTQTPHILLCMWELKEISNYEHRLLIPRGWEEWRGEREFELKYLGKIGYGLWTLIHI